VRVDSVEPAIVNGATDGERRNASGWPILPCGELPVPVVLEFAAAVGVVLRAARDAVATRPVVRSRASAGRADMPSTLQPRRPGVAQRRSGHRASRRSPNAPTNAQRGWAASLYTTIPTEPHRSR
jgi:hypothetical protein